MASIVSWWRLSGPSYS